jgi:hypothetical protein
VSARRVDAFFYGLFMDADLLRGSGVAPTNARRARVDGYALRVGQRAILVPTAAGRHAYGMLMSLTHAELDRLYGAPGLAQYRPEALLVQPLDGPSTPARCYKLTVAPAPHDRNPDYTARLRRALQKLEFPPEYIAAVA